MEGLGVPTFLVVILIFSTKAHCKPYGLHATDVGATSAVLHWHSTEKTVEEFEIQCCGSRHYKTANGTEHTDIDKVTHYAPKGSDHLLIGNMKENFNYSCIVIEDVTEGSQILEGTVSDPCYFQTDYGAPEQPQSPVVHIQKHVVAVNLFKASSKFGPIHGYEVQFHLVNGWTTDSKPFIDLGEMVVGHLASLEESQQSVDPVSFKIPYNSSNLPETITINADLLGGALKNGIMYSIVTVAYTTVEKTHNSSFILSNATLPSHPFTAVGHASALSSTSTASLSGCIEQLGLALGLGVALPMVLLGYIVCVGVFIYCRETRLKKQQAYTRSDIIKARKESDRTPDFEVATRGNLPWLDPFKEASNPQIPLLESTQQNDETTNNQNTVVVTVEVHETSMDNESNETQLSQQKESDPSVYFDLSKSEKNSEQSLETFRSSNVLLQDDSNGSATLNSTECVESSSKSQLSEVIENGEICSHSIQELNDDYTNDAEHKLSSKDNFLIETEETQNLCLSPQPSEDTAPMANPDSSDQSLPRDSTDSLSENTLPTLSQNSLNVEPSMKDISSDSIDTRHVLSLHNISYVSGTTSGSTRLLHSSDSSETTLYTRSHLGLVEPETGSSHTSSDVVLSSSIDLPTESTSTHTSSHSSSANALYSGGSVLASDSYPIEIDLLCSCSNSENQSGITVSSSSAHNTDSIQIDVEDSYISQAVFTDVIKTQSSAEQDKSSSSSILEGGQLSPLVSTDTSETFSSSEQDITPKSSSSSNDSRSHSVNLNPPLTDNKSSSRVLECHSSDIVKPSSSSEVSMLHNNMSNISDNNSGTLANKSVSTSSVSVSVSSSSTYENDINNHTEITFDKASETTSSPTISMHTRSSSSLSCYSTDYHSATECTENCPTCKGRHMPMHRHTGEHNTAVISSNSDFLFIPQPYNVTPPTQAQSAIALQASTPEAEKSISVESV